MRFLIADDSDTSLHLLEQMLEELGHEVVGTARDGLEALEQYEALHPDAVIMDLIMPRMNGQEAMREILRIDPRAEIVIASTMRSPKSALDCQREGARFFLYKPYDLDHIRNVVGKLLPARENGEP